jgi:integrase
MLQRKASLAGTLDTRSSRGASAEVDTGAVLAVLKPLWQSIPETASRLRGRIEAVLAFAKARGWRSGENPASWRGHLALILPKRGKLSRGHHAAMDYRDVPAFIAQLRECNAIAPMALEFCVLTATRADEVLGARWDEFDLGAKGLVIPAHCMKSCREHRVPWSTKAFAIVEVLATARVASSYFPGSGRKPL